MFPIKKRTVHRGRDRRRECVGAVKIYAFLSPLLPIRWCGIWDLGTDNLFLGPALF